MLSYSVSSCGRRSTLLRCASPSPGHPAGRRPSRSHGVWRPRGVRPGGPLQRGRRVLVAFLVSGVEPEVPLLSFGAADQCQVGRPVGLPAITVGHHLFGQVGGVAVGPADRCAQDQLGLSQHRWAAPVDASVYGVAGGVAPQDVADAFGGCHGVAAGARAQVCGRQQCQRGRIGRRKRARWRCSPCSVASLSALPWWATRAITSAGKRFSW
jgi:hypothetical protein